MNISEAKELFQEMGCSHFHMFRENPSYIYNHYMNLNISDFQEKEWRAESIDDLKSKMMIKDTPDLWSLHCSLTDLVIAQATQESINLMIAATEEIESRLSSLEKVIVSENINGRRDFILKDGLIFLSLKLKQGAAAKRFAECSIRLCNEVLSDLQYEDLARCLKSLKRTKRTMRTMKYWCLTRALTLP